MALNFGSEFLVSMPPIETTLPFEELVDNRASLTKHRDTYSFIDPFRFRNKLRGKVVLITQAHRGIGRSTAVAFARKTTFLISPQPFCVILLDNFVSFPLQDYVIHVIHGFDFS